MEFSHRSYRIELPPFPSQRYDDVKGACSKKTKWRLIAGTLAVFQGVLATVNPKRKRIFGNAGCTKYRGKDSPRALDTGYVACIS